MTQQQLGDFIGELFGKPWPRQAVSNAEKGGRVFGAADLVTLAMALRCPIAFLLEPPAGVEVVSIGDGPDVPSGYFRVTTADDPDLAMLIEDVTQLRQKAVSFHTDANTVVELIERTYRDLQHALQPGGQDGDS